MKDKNEVCVVGLGYIGLPTSAMFAAKKKKVIGVDVNQHTVDTINAGKIHIVEPELDTMVKKAVDGGFLRATITPEPADAFLIAVPTPFLPVKDQSSIPEPDLSYIKSAADLISKVLKKGDLVILESTSPVGATEQLSDWLAQARQDLTFPLTHGEDSDIRIAHCPERVLPGQIIRELINNDRVIGGITKECSAAATELYKIFVKGDCIETNSRTAEMVKLTENASRDVSIAFANELSVICDNFDIDIWELIDLANRHPRVNILQPGPGVGGHCIAVDPWFIVSKAKDNAKLMKTAREVNDQKPKWVINKIKAAVEDYLVSFPEKSASEIKIACFGIAFKADIDDLRESPAMAITQAISEWHLGKVLIVEPNIQMLPDSLSKCQLISHDEAISKSDIIIMLVNHKEFYELDYEDKIVIDTKGVIRK